MPTEPMPAKSALIARKAPLAFARRVRHFATTARHRSLSAILALFAFVALFPCAARAQSASVSAAQFDVSGAYAYIHAGSADIGGAFNLNGGSGSLAYNFSDRFSAIADVGGYRFSGLPSGLSSNLYTYLFGPRYTLRKSRRFVPFAQVLLGGARVTARSGNVNAGENAFSASVGAGLDLALRERVSLRVLQADYLLTRFPNLNGNSATENHVRISVGIVFHFGTR